MPPRNFKRRWRLIIYPRFQFTLVALNLGLITAIFLIFMAQQGRAYHHLLEMGAAAQLAPEHPFFKLIEYQTRDLWFNMSLAYGGAILVSSLVTLQLSNKLAGPIVRLKGFFTRIGDSGRVGERLDFRKNDFFSELPAEIRRALDALASQSAQKKPQSGE
jgi:hypothetical protein